MILRNTILTATALCVGLTAVMAAQPAAAWERGGGYRGGGYGGYGGYHEGGWRGGHGDVGGVLVAGIAGLAIGAALSHAAAPPPYGYVETERYGDGYRYGYDPAYAPAPPPGPYCQRQWVWNPYIAAYQVQRVCY